MHHLGAILLLILAFLLLGPLVVSAFSLLQGLVEPLQAMLATLNLTRYVAPASLVAVLVGGLAVLVIMKVTLGT